MASSTGRLRAGAAQVNITPRLGCHLQGSLTDRVSDHLHDDLWAKAIVLDDGETRIGFVVCDLIVVLGEMTGEAKRLAAEAAGIPPENLLISATHTHYGPSLMDIALVPVEEEYKRWVPQRIAEAVVLAARRLRPAQVGFAVGSCPTEVHNRRHRMKDGTVRMNHGALHPDIVEPAGPTDPDLSVLILRTPEREPIAVLANLALHYVGSRGLDVSADYFGFFASSLQRCAGAPFLVAMSNGCQGDINNINTARAPAAAPDPYFHARRVGDVCAGEAWKTWNTLREDDFRDDLPLGAALTTIDIEPRMPNAEQLEEARAYLAAHPVEADPVRWMYAREVVELHASFPRRIELPVQAFRIGEVGYVGLPGEVFCEIGLAIKERSPFARTVCIGLANDCAGYIPTDQAIDEGGYEVTLCRWCFAPKGTAERWSTASLRLLEGLAGPGLST